MKRLHTMQHRHVDSQEYTLTTIDDIISRGKHKDWIELRDAVRADPEIAAMVQKVCAHYASEENIRHDFWPVYLRHCGYE